MISESKYNPIGDFDFRILDDPEFKEDAVREEILSPIIKALGYSADGKNKIIRSRKLIHPIEGFKYSLNSGIFYYLTSQKTTITPIKDT